MRFRLHARSALTVVEVLVALMLVSVGLMGIAGTSALSFRTVVAAERERRRANGAKQRAEYETGSTTARQPWLAAGISRRTWYRRGTGPCPT